MLRDRPAPKRATLLTAAQRSALGARRREPVPQPCNAREGLAVAYGLCDGLAMNRALKGT